MLGLLKETVDQCALGYQRAMLIQMAVFIQKALSLAHSEKL